MAREQKDMQNTVLQKNRSSCFLLPGQLKAHMENSGLHAVNHFIGVLRDT